MGTRIVRRCRGLMAGILLAPGLAVLLAPGGDAQAEATATRTTDDLRLACVVEDSARRHFCFGFILGAGQLYAELLRAEVIPEWACPEPTPTLEEIRLAFVAWADANPEQASSRAVDGLMQATAETWPCG